MLWDVITVGMGPAGSRCAEVLASKGFKTLVLEKERFPRLKICAGGVGIRVIEKYKIPIEVGVEIRNMLFVAPSGFHYEVDPGQVLGATIPRAVLDSILAERAKQAGAVVREGERVVRVKVYEDRVKVVTRNGEVYEARAVIGADGVNSVVARSLGLMPKKWYTKNAFCPVAYIPSPPPREDETVNEFYMGYLGAGYAWVFRHKDHINVGIGTLRENYNTTPRRAILRFLKEHPVASKRVKGEPEKVLGFYIPYNGMPRKIYTDRAVLVGDAGGFVNTLTGEGIRMGMLSAELAAEVMERALSDGEPTAEKLSEYQRLAEEHPEVGQELKLARLMRQLMFKDINALDAMIRAAAEDRRLQLLMVAMIYTLRPYPELVPEMIKSMPITLSFKLFKAAPSEVLRLVLRSGDPYFPD